MRQQTWWLEERPKPLALLHMTEGGGFPWTMQSSSSVSPCTTVLLVLWMITSDGTVSPRKQIFHPL